MPIINLSTTIDSDLKTVFDLARSIDLHLESSADSKEEAIGGVTSGLIGLGERVRWRAKHFGVWFEMETEITEYREYDLFSDKMVDGPFAYLFHRHTFEERGGAVAMIDYFEFRSPLGFLGKIADIFIKPHLIKYLQHRNKIIKDKAEKE
jgi:ligand-binding SRPBCC domain-containing protein